MEGEVLQDQPTADGARGDYNTRDADTDSHISALTGDMQSFAQLHLPRAGDPSTHHNCCPSAWKLLATLSQPLSGSENNDSISKVEDLRRHWLLYTC